MEVFDTRNLERRKEGWLARLARDFFNAADLVEESVIYRVKEYGEYEYDPEFGKFFDKTTGITHCGRKSSISP